MCEVQDEDHGSNFRSYLHRVGGADGVLEDPLRVRARCDIDVFAGKKHTATLCGLRSSGLIRIKGAGDQQVSCALLEFESLRLTYYGALRRLEGELWTTLLGSELLLLSRADRPIYAPHPGADAVLVARFVTPQLAVSPSELFLRISERMLEGYQRFPVLIT
jgi:hypothetical protein